MHAIAIGKPSHFCKNFAPKSCNSDGHLLSSLFRNATLQSNSQELFSSSGSSLIVQLLVANDATSKFLDVRTDTVSWENFHDIINAQILFPNVIQNKEKPFTFNMFANDVNKTSHIHIARIH